VRVSFDGLYIRCEIQRIYNTGYIRDTASLRASGGATLLSTEAAQYDFVTHHAIELAFGAPDVYKLTGGHIAFNNMGAANPLGAHRALTDEGVGANFSAVDTDQFRSVLPDIELTVTAATGPTPYFTTNITGVTATYSLGAAASPLKVTVAAAQPGTLTYQWYALSSGSAAYKPINGAVSSAYTPPTEEYGTRYKGRRDQHV
jgi:hypothetical protein